MVRQLRRSPSGSQNGYTRQTTLTYPLMATLTENTQTDAAVPEALLGDVVSVSPPAAGLAAGMVIAQAWVPAAGSVSISLYNSTAGNITPGAVVFGITLHHQ
jgi:hypothetical protein